MASQPVVGADVAAAIARYAPRSLPEETATFVRALVAAAEPPSPARAKALLFACAQLGQFASSVGLELSFEVCLHPSVIERFIVTEGRALSAPTRRTLRSNLRFVARAVVLDQPPGPVPLARERAKAPYDEGELAAYLALADAQPNAARRHRLGALVCLGAGAGLSGPELRGVSSSDVVARSGGVLVDVGGRRPRAVPVLSRFHERLLAAAGFLTEGFLTGGRAPSRRNVTGRLVGSVGGGTDLPRLEVARLRATWLAHCSEALGLKGFMDAAGITCSQRLGDLVAQLPATSEPAVVALLGGTS